MGSLITTERSQDAVAENQQYLTFSLAEEMFALGIQRVREIIEFDNVTTVPMMPKFVKGVINLRGSVVPVIDLSARFGRGASEIQRRTCIIIVEIEHEGQKQELGVIVDAVSEVLELPQSEIEPPPGFGARIRADFISGMGKVNGRFVILIDVDKVLAVEEMAMLAELDDQDPVDEPRG
jgi:purine-binding chemotaxis protein CheW